MSELLGDRANGTSSLEVEGLVLPDLGIIGFGLDLAVNRLDAASVQRIRATLDAAREAGELGQGELGGIYPHIERDLQSLLQAGAGLRVDRFVLSLPEGQLTATLRFDLPEADPGAGFSWPALLLALKASADVRVPAAMVEMAQEANPQQAGTLVAMGILKREGDAYVVKAEYAQGLVTVNGAPMPIPLGTLSRQTPATELIPSRSPTSRR
jgi:uncharacterized protein YdgA (DUF945 family)